MKNYSKANNVKHIVDGIPLFRWCTINNYPYSYSIQLIKNGMSIEEMKSKIENQYYSSKELSKSLKNIAYLYAKEYPLANRERRLEIRKKFRDINNSKTYEKDWEAIVSGNHEKFKTDDLELWKPVIGDKNLEVSNQGNFRRFYTNGTYRKIKIFSVKKKNKSGIKERVFLAVKVLDRPLCRAARLVAEAWIPKKSTDVAVHHIDGDYSNIHPSNLKWVSKSMHGMLTGYSIKRSKPVDLYNCFGHYVETFDSVREAAKELGVSYQTISDICRNRIKKPMFDVRYKENPEFINCELLKKKYINKNEASVQS